MIFYPTISRGELGKYATVSRVLLPASSWARDEVKKYGIVRKAIPVPRLPETVVDAAADCGGFVATRKWGGIGIRQSNMWRGSRPGSHTGRPSWTTAVRMRLRPGNRALFGRGRT